MAARDQERPARLGQRTVLDEVDRDVADQVVDAVERLAGRGGQRLGRGESDHQRTHQAGPGGDSDGVQFGQVDVGLGERAPQRRHHRLQMGPRSHLGDDPAPARVLIDRGRDHVGQQLPPAHDADAGLVAGGLDAQHQRAGHALHSHSGEATSSAMTRACRPGP